MTKQYKNNIFDILKEIENKNYRYYESLSEDLQKEIQPYTLCRWMSAMQGNNTQHEELTLKVNNNVNKNYWIMSKYKDLQWKLLCTCGLKKFVKHQWIPLNKEKDDKDYKIIRNFYSNLNDDEFKLKYENMSDNEKLIIKHTLGICK